MFDAYIDVNDQNSFLRLTIDEFKLFEQTKKSIKIIEEVYVGKTRCDGKTPYITHLYSVARFAYLKCNGYYNLHECLEFYDNLFSVALLHDIVEDGLMTVRELIEYPGRTYNTKVIDYIEMLNENNFDSFELYIANMHANFLCLLVKGCDRIHNLMHMNEGFSLRKQLRYISETLLFITPIFQHSVEDLNDKNRCIIESILKDLENICKEKYYEIVSKIKEEGK